MTGLLPDPVPVSRAEPTQITAVELTLATRLGLSWPDAGLSRQITLPRVQVEGWLGSGPVDARLKLRAVRSGGEQGYIGVDGEAIVPEIEVAEARARLPSLGLGGGAGIIEDGWASTGETAWGMPDLEPGFGVARGWLYRSDLGVWGGWTAPGARAFARVELTSGEGANRAERNDGKNLAALVAFQPWGERLVVSAYGRDGSRGLELAADRRAGVRVAGEIGPARIGAEGLYAWGVDEDSSRQAAGASAWLVVTPGEHLLGAARVDQWTEARGDADAGASVAVAALGARWDLPHGELRLLGGWRGSRTGDDALALAGATGLSQAQTLFLQVGLDLAALHEGAP